MYNLRREHGFPGAFLQAVRKYEGFAVLETGLFDDPRYSMPLPACPAIVVWKMVNPSSCPLFAGPCFGDGSVFGGEAQVSARAGWGVVELNANSLPATVFRRAYGTVPGPVQTISGAELYALLTWIRNLDPCYDDHRFYTDSSWVFSGWYCRYATGAAATPFREWWAEVERLRSEWPVGVLRFF